jgi:hypothetical protein
MRCFTSSVIAPAAALIGLASAGLDPGMAADVEVLQGRPQPVERYVYEDPPVAVYPTPRVYYYDPAPVVVVPGPYYGPRNYGPIYGPGRYGPHVARGYGRFGGHGYRGYGRW